MDKIRNESYFLKRFIRKQIFQKNFSFRLLINKLKLIRIIYLGEQLRKRNQKKWNCNIPPICVLSVTDQCNLKCLGCYANVMSKNKIISEKDIERIIQEAVDLGIYLFVLAGGEPLMVKNLVNIISKYPKAIFLLFTNGLLLSDTLIENIKYSRNIFPVLSYEGNEVFNDFRRGEGSGILIEHSLRKLKNSKLIFGFSTMALPKNVKYITSKSYFDKMEENGASFGFVIDYILVGKNKNGHTKLSKEDIVLKNHELLNREKDSSLVIFNLPEDEKITGKCWAGTSLINVNAEGGVEPCMFLPISEKNIKQHRLIEILKSDLLKEERSNACNSSTLEEACFICNNKNTELKMMQGSL